jgi:hypothetical protein
VKSVKTFFVFPIALSVGVSLAQGAAITIPVMCGGNQVGVITAQNGALAITGSFSTVPMPPNAGTLAAAAAACGETQFNWYQVVTADNMPPSNFAGQQLAAPYVDPPPGGYAIADDNTWFDNLPWLYNMGPATPAAGQVVVPGLSLAANTTATTLNYGDMPGGPNGTVLSFSTWLVSLNANGSFQGFDGGFTWTWQNPGGVVTVGQPVALGAGVNPTAAQYQNIIGGFATQLAPEPSTLTLLAGGLVLGAVFRRRIK